MLDAAQAGALAVFPDGISKAAGITTGEAAAAAMIASRVNDGSAPETFYLPSSTDPYQWRLTAGCTTTGGLSYNWRSGTPDRRRPLLRVIVARIRNQYGRPTTRRRGR